MATLDSSFEAQLETAVLDNAEERLRDPDGPVATAIERSEERLREVADRNDYSIESVLDSLEGPDVTREGGVIRVSWRFAHSAAGFFESGTSDHTVNGNPVISFLWHDAPPEVREDFSDTFPRVFFHSTDVSGLEASHFTREGLDALVRELGEPR